MTTLALDRSCMFCGLPAWRRPAASESPANDFDCARCGRYRVGETAEARMRGNGMNRYISIVPMITGANDEGFRLVIPSCYRVPLFDERVVPIVAQADMPVKRHASELPSHPVLTPRRGVPIQPDDIASDNERPGSLSS